MKWFILFLTIQSAWAQPDYCQRLPEIAKGLEKDLMGSRLKNCAELSALSIQKDATALQIDIISKGKMVDGEQVEPAQCLPLSTLGVRIKELENRLTLLNGFEKLKNDLVIQKADTASPDKKRALESGKSFKENLEIAGAFDLLLNSETPKENAFLQELKDIPEEKRSNAADMVKAIKTLCEKKSPLPLCQDSFALSETTVLEINEILKTKITEKELEKWQTALAITKKDGSEYSFSQMQSELSSGLSKLNTDQNLSSTELKVIQALPDFANKKTGLRFIDDLQASKNTPAIDAQITRSKFGSLVDDLILRQQEEIKSKISITWVDYNESKDLIPKEDKANVVSAEEESQCAQGYRSYTDSVQCIANLKKISTTIQGAKKAHLEQITTALQSSANYVNYLNEVKKICAQGGSECGNKLTMDQTNLTQELQILKGLEQQILSENSKLKTLRNFALENLDSQKCLQKAATYVGQCVEELSPVVSPEAESLIISGAQILLVETLPKDEESKTNIDDICEEETKSIEEELCNLSKGINKPTKKDPPKNSALTEELNIPDLENKYNPTRSAIAQGLSNILGQAANMLRSSISPYPQYNYMNPAASRPLSISDNIIRSAQTQSGYGVYSAYTPSMSRYFAK